MQHSPPNNFLLSLLPHGQYKKSKKDLSKTIQTNLTSLDQIETEINSLNFPQKTNDLKSGLSLISDYKSTLHRLIDYHFSDVEYNYLTMYSSTCPCTDLKEILNHNISQLKEELATNEKNIEDDLSNLDFYLKDYNGKVGKLRQMIALIKENENSANQNQPLPIIDVNIKRLEGLYHQLKELISTSLSHIDSKININRVNYFQNSSFKSLLSLNDEAKTASFYNIADGAVKTVAIDVNFEIPYSPGVIITPTPNIYVIGGVLNNGNITGKMWEFVRKESNSLVEMQSMLVKRVGHSICYVDLGGDKGGAIFVVGGRTNHGVRTKLCEKFLINENRWEKIAMLNFARSRAAICPFNDQFIFAFYGTDSENKNTGSIESYDITTDKWEIVNVINHINGLEVSFAGALQINESEILIFGGFHESYNEEGEIVSSRKLMTLNVQNDCALRIYNENLPLDFCLTNGATPIIEENNIYCQGFFFKNAKKPVSRCLDYDYIMNINERNIEIKNLIPTGKAARNKIFANSPEVKIKDMELDERKKI